MVLKQTNMSATEKTVAKNERKQQAESEFEKVQTKQEAREEQLQGAVTTLKSTDENRRHNCEVLKKSKQNEPAVTSREKRPDPETEDLEGLRPEGQLIKCYLVPWCPRLTPA